MNCKKLRIIMLLITSLAPAAAMAAGTDDLKGKILVYNFYNLSRNISHGYYSYVIPDSITTELKKSPQYDVKSIPVAMEYADSSMAEEKYKTYLRLLADRGKEFSADFIISGSYSIEDRKIVIKTQIYDVNEQKIKDISESSEELGALLLVIIDQLSEKINTELQKGLEIKKSRVAVSPFIPFYTSISGITFGVNYGVASVYGDWGEIYDQKIDVVTLYLRYGLSNFESLKQSEILRDITVSAEYDYASFSNDSDSGGQRTYMAVRGATLNISYPYRFTPQFYLDAQAGAGMAFSKIEVIMEGSGGPGDVLASEISMDPYLNLSVGMSFLFDHFRLATGVSFRRIFYSDKAMDMSVLYFGLGWTI